MTVPGKDDVEEIDDEAVEEAVSEIAEDSRDKEDGADACWVVGEISTFCQKYQRAQGNTRKNNEEEVVVLQHSKGSAGIVDLDEIEKAGDDRNRIVRADESQDKPLGGLVEQVEWESEDKKQLHEIAGTACSQRRQSVG